MIVSPKKSSGSFFLPNLPLILTREYFWCGQWDINISGRRHWFCPACAPRFIKILDQFGNQLQLGEKYTGEEEEEEINITFSIMVIIIVRRRVWFRSCAGRQLVLKSIELSLTCWEIESNKLDWWLQYKTNEASWAEEIYSGNYP